MRHKGYFKSTTRTILTEAEKQETLAVIDRGIDYLVKMKRRWEYPGDEADLRFAHVALYHFRRQDRYLSICCNLLKGYTQPKTFYRMQRTWEIEGLSKKISEETGADYNEVNDLFIKLMVEFLHLTFMKS